MRKAMSTDPERVNYFAETDSRNRRVKFGVKNKDRSRHVYVIGKTGMGKSTLLENMAVQDIQNGEGMAFIDPHGKSAEQLLDYVPPHRLKDVIRFAPHDLEYPVSFNVMEDVGPDRRHLVASGLMSAFKKIWVDAWSARMEYILNNILLALLEYPDSTLVGVNRMLADKTYRDKVVDNVTDTSVKAFWTEEFAKYGERYMQEAGASIQNKIGQFISNPVIRNIIGQPHSTFDLRRVMDEQKILIMDLSKGKVGETNANLMGSMLITKLYLAAMSRAEVDDATMEQLPPFYTYVDEFQSFANESFADILSESRKYKLSLTMAHQYIEQMSDEVRAAVFGNVGTMVTFRIGGYDAEVLEKEFLPQFEANDMVNLGFSQIYLKLMIDGVTSPPFSATTIPPIQLTQESHRDEIIEHSRQQFARRREDVEKDIQEWQAEGSGEAPPQGKDGGGQQQKQQKQEGQKQKGGNDKKDKGGQGKKGEPKKQDKQKPDEKTQEDLRSILSQLSNQHQQESGDGQQDKKKKGQQTEESRLPKGGKQQAQEKKGKKDKKDTKESGERSNSLKDALAKQGVLDTGKAEQDKVSAADTDKKEKKEQSEKESPEKKQRSAEPAQENGSPEKKSAQKQDDDSEKEQGDAKRAKESTEQTAQEARKGKAAAGGGPQPSQKESQEGKEPGGEDNGARTEEASGRAGADGGYQERSGEVPRQVLQDLLEMDEEYDEQTPRQHSSGEQ